MRYDNTLKLFLSAPAPIPIRIGLNNKKYSTFTINDPQIYCVNLSHKQAHEISIEQTDNQCNEFLHVEKIVLGNINITGLMHIDHVCSVVLKKNNQLIGQFVDTLGSPDMMKITIDVLFYRIVMKNLERITSIEETMEDKWANPEIWACL